MRQRRWVVAVVCLSVSLLLLSQLSSASTTFHVNEADTRLLLEDKRTKVSLAVVNPLGREFPARVRLEVLDPEGKLRASSESEESIRRGSSALVLSMPLEFAGLDKDERNELLWYRLRYIITPAQSAGGAATPLVEGIVSLSEITPDLFELRVTTTTHAREGSRYHAQATAIHPVSSRPVSGIKVEAEIAFSNGDKKGVVKAGGVTNAEGFAPLDFDLPKRIDDDGDLELKVVASRGQLVDEAESEVELAREAIMMLSTDKPLYQPGQTLHLRALVFDDSKHALADAGGELMIDDPEGNTVFRSSFKTSRFGIAGVDWPIPENTRLGDYVARLKLEDERYDEQEADQSVKISRYDLPNFAVGVKPDRAYYLPGQDAEIEVRADYLFGQPVKRGRVRVVREMERRWNYREQKWETEEAEKYEGETDADGHYSAHINLQKAHSTLAGEDYSRFHDLTYAAYFTDPTTNRTEQRRFDLRVTKDAIHVYVFEGVERQAKNFPLQFYLSTYYADGSPAECEVEIRGAGESSHANASSPLLGIRTNRYGVAKVDGLTLPRSEGNSHTASLAFLARDAKGALGHQSNDFWYAGRSIIRLETDKAIYRPGEPIKADITASDPQMRLFVEVWKGEVALRSEAVELRDGRAQLTIPYSANFGAGVTLTAYAAPGTQNDYYDYNWPTASRRVIYPRERDLRLNVQLSQQTYRPGDEAHADFSVRAPGGDAIESALGIVVFDKAVEERARTDREFGSNYGFYEAYSKLSGYQGSVSGISGADLFKLDMSKPVPTDVALVAEILLRTYGRVPRVFGGHNSETNPRELFTRLIEKQTAPVKEALTKHYEQKMQYPRDEATFRSLLETANVDFDGVLDPWGTPYRTRFYIEREADVLEFVSAGADKRFQTTDDFNASKLSWPYFRPLGEIINRANASYHARTGGFIRDAATLKNELRAAGVDLDALRDRWGQPYRFDFAINGISYLINILSGGPDGKFDERARYDSDNFVVWASMSDYFADPRAKIEQALSDFVRKTKRFPQNETELREALSRSNISLDELRDPWGHNYSAIFSHDARYDAPHVLRSYSRYGEQGKLKQEVSPPAPRINHLFLRSHGPDGKAATYDDFNVAGFSRLFVESSTPEDKGRKQGALSPVAYSGASGAISGEVIDVAGAVAPGVKVLATHLTTLQEYETTTDDEGHYVLRNLPVGFYKVQFSLPGFSELFIDQVAVRSSNLTKLDATLQVAGTTETVSVTSDNAEILNAANQSLGTNISTTQLSNFPTQRSVQSLYTLTRAGKSQGKENNYMLDAGSDQMATPRLRENFSETLIWQPSLETDREGRAALDFKLADNITTWKMAIVGSTVDGQIGIVEKEFRAFQPFFVEHDPPRVLTEGDEIQLPVVIRNYLEKQQDVDLQILPAEWFTLLGPAQKSLTVPAGDSSRQTFDFRASASIKNGSQQITARAEEGSDAIVKLVNVHPDGEEAATTDSQIVTRSAALNLNLPGGVIKNSARAELKIYPNLMAHVFESIEGILHRPYGCGEQTISSTYPSLLVLRHDRRVNRQSTIAPKASRYLQAGYERLLNYRTASGGFSYWGGHQEPDLALTAYALRFLTEAKEFIAVDEAVTNAARDWLITQQRPDGHWPARYSEHGDARPDIVLTAYIARVLAKTNAPATTTAPATNAQAVAPQGKPAASATTAGQQDKPVASAAEGQNKPAPLVSLQRALAYLSRRIEESNEPYLIAAYSLAARDAGDASAAARANAKLRSLAQKEGSTTYWSLETSTPFYGWGLAGRIETTALVVQALARENQLDDEMINRGLLFLLRGKDRYGVWYSTQATINVLDTLIALLSKEREDTNASKQAPVDDGNGGGGGPIEVVVNGRRAATVAMPSVYEPASPLIVDLSPFISPGENRIELQRDGRATPASAQVVATYYVPWTTTTAGDGNNPAATTATKASSALNLKVVFDKSEVAINDEVTCKVMGERTGNSGYGMLLAEIGLPPGADVDRASLDKAMKDSSWSLTRYDILPDRLVVYLWPPKGGTSFEFKFRPRYGLTAQTAPSQIYDYYNPEARKVVAPTKFVVR